MRKVCAFCATGLLAVGALRSQTTADGIAPASPARGQVARVFVETRRATLVGYASAATDVVRGRIVGRGEPVVPDRGLPFTVFPFEVSAAIRGDASGVVELCVGGVETPEQRVIVDAAPELLEGAEYVLFLQHIGPYREYGILGLADGTLRVQAAPDGEPLVEGRLAHSGETLSAFEGRVRAAGGSR